LSPFALTTSRTTTWIGRDVAGRRRVDERVFLTKKRPNGVLPSVRPDFSMISTPSLASSLKPRPSRIVANWPSRLPT
jgi:hypothetical protein